MSNTHGGARKDAGRPFTPIERAAEPQTPIMWLWQELARQFGKETSDGLRREFNQRSQDYQKAQIVKQRERRKQMEQAEQARQAWKNNEINTATDLMEEAGIDITPENLSKYVQKHWEMPYSEQEAAKWLEKQDWYKNS